jgi:ATP-dependent DNA helicase RecG
MAAKDKFFTPVREKVRAWLKEGESERLEFKISFGQDTIESLVAFANTRGGIVVLGVSDTGDVKGVALAKEIINQWINEVKSKTAPQLVPDAEIAEMDGKMVVCMAISEYPVKPVACKGRYYKRVGNTNHLLSIQDVVNIHLQSVNTSWDFYPRPGKDIFQISLEKVTRQIEIVGKRKESAISEDPLTFLREHSLIDGEKITNACWLLFLPEQESTTTIELGHFASPTVIKDSLTLKMDLFTEVEEVMNFIRKHISKAIVITGDPRNTERWQYPLEAIRELVLNMIVHRDYTSSYDSTIKIYDDHIQFYNPGALPDSISIEQLLSNDYVSQPRNRQIAEMFKETGMIEKYGSGIRRVCNAFADYGLPVPKFTKLPNGMIVEVFAEKKAVNDLYMTGEPEVEYIAKRPGRNKYVVENDVIADRLGDRLGDSQQSILKVIKNNPYISLSRRSKEIGISQTAIEKNVNKLKRTGLLLRVGSNKTGYWKITQK